jgi:hypothetical protein
MADGCFGAEIRSQPALNGANFEIQGTFHQPEPINQWLAQNGFPRGSIFGISSAT